MSVHYQSCLAHIGVFDFILDCGVAIFARGLMLTDHSKKSSGTPYSGIIANQVKMISRSNKAISGWVELNIR